jgi:hypothetical protein
MHRAAASTRTLQSGEEFWPSAALGLPCEQVPYPFADHFPVQRVHPIYRKSRKIKLGKIARPTFLDLRRIGLPRMKSVPAQILKEESTKTPWGKAKMTIRVLTMHVGIFMWTIWVSIFAQNVAKKG